MRAFVFAFGLISTIATAQQIKILPTDKIETCLVVVDVLKDHKGNVKGQTPPRVDCEFSLHYANPNPVPTLPPSLKFDKSPF